jgi:hypothetical protein
MEGPVTESLLLSPDMGAACALREWAYAWEHDPLTSEGGRSLEYLVLSSLQMASGLQLAWSLATEQDKVWESGSYLRRVQALDFLAGVVVDMLTRTREIVASTQARHPEWLAPPQAVELDSRLQALKELAAAIRKTLAWINRPRPAVSQDMLQRSQASLDRGEGEAVGEIIARLKNGGPLVRE